MSEGDIRKWKEFFFGGGETIPTTYMYATELLGDFGVSSLSLWRIYYSLYLSARSLIRCPLHI